MRPLVSVILPSYNHAPFIRAAIQSALDQSYDNIEVIVTDDGSRDGTPDLVRGFSDERVSLEVFPENCGASVAANSAIRRARGELICTLSSDDYFLPGKVEKQVAFLDDNPAIAAVFGLPRLIDERGLTLPQGAGLAGVDFRAPLHGGLRSRQDWLRRFFLDANCLCQPTAMLRRSVLDKIGGFDPRLASLPDLDLWVRLCMEREIHLMPEEMTAFRIRDGGRNQSAPRPDTIRRSLIEQFYILKHYRRLSREAILAIFGRDLRQHDANLEGSREVLLAQMALLGRHLAHRLFAVDTMFNQASPSNGDYRLLHDLAGAIDPFGIQAMDEATELRDRVGAAQGEIARLSRDLADARAEIARLRDKNS
jgi:glycosyltransferase involved in cell wall biosynthesis